MSHQISTTLQVNLSASKIWDTLKDYGGIEKYAPTIKSSSIEGEKSSGIGARRRVTFHHDGSSLIEEIIEYQEGQGYKMNVSELSSPLKSMQAEIKVDKLDDNSSEITMSVSFETNSGPVG